MDVKLIWSTPDAEKLILYMARVSNPDNQNSERTALIQYLIQHKHWSPFEMANMCVEVSTSRAISTQIMRHRSFSFQEFSQRYAEVQTVECYEARRQDREDRQNSIDDLPTEVKEFFLNAQFEVYRAADRLYHQALAMDIAKESARFLLPISASTRLYMNGNVRSWIHYLESRCAPETQFEHREIALAIRAIFCEQFPIIGKALKWNENLTLST